MRTNESILIERILDGHDEDYGYFIERYGDETLALVMRLVSSREDAEEIVQDAFVSAFDHLCEFHGRSKFSTWLCSIAYRKALSYLRQRKIKYVEINENTNVSDSDIDETLADEQRTRQLQRAVKMLKPEEQALITMFYYDNRHINDIALIIGQKPNNIATRLHRIRKKLYLLIKENYEDGQ